MAASSLGKISGLHILGLLCGAFGSILTLIVWYQSVMNQTFKGLDFFLVLLIVFPAFLALISSFVHAPVIAIPFIWSLPLSFYLLVESWVLSYATSCLLYAVSSYLKWKGQLG
jgi:hypothetical protein